MAPHHTDVPLRDIVDVVLDGRPAGVSFPGANPRHAHEWKIWKEVKLPAGKIILPRMIDSTTNVVEHPSLPGSSGDQFVAFTRRAMPLTRRPSVRPLK
jgi:5-methyltetrahydropteroyltriglutamate--homocysteine methyltransferase